MKKIILSALLLSAAFVSCKKDDKTCDLNNTNIVGSYKITAFTYKADAATAPIDVFATFDACEKDDIITFNANNTTTTVDAGVVCSPAGGDTGTWFLSGTSITVDGEVGTVSSFNCSGMTVSLPGTAVGEVSTVTLAKQ